MNTRTTYGLAGSLSVVSVPVLKITFNRLPILAQHNQWPYFSGISQDFSDIFKDFKIHYWPNSRTDFYTRRTSESDLYTRHTKETDFYSRHTIEPDFGSRQTIEPNFCTTHTIEYRTRLLYQIQFRTRLLYQTNLRTRLLY